jgi:hypothetical protein
MANRLSWWMIPASVVVLVRVVTLPVQSVEPEPAAPPPLGEMVALPSPFAETIAPIEASFPTGKVMLQGADGTRTGPLALPVAEGMVLRLSPHVVGQEVRFSIRRYAGGEPESEPWISGSTCLRPDATIPILGLGPGRYRVRVRWWNQAWWPTLACQEVDVEAGGTVDLR